jgi:Cu(I)/Ag(I) efflux system membrane fusion protein
MAFKGRGASWLQADEQVLNPYYGASMLKCADDVAMLWGGPPAVEAGPRPPETPRSFREQLGRIWKAYLETQDALASDDLGRARSNAGEIDKALVGVDASVLEGKTRESWDRERTSLRAAIDRMTAADDLERLRAGFALLSEEMPVIFETFAPDIDGDAYRMHCPMAFDGRGAAWLQAAEEPRNPYFGAAMLRCVDQVERLAIDARPATETGGGRRHD